MAFDMEEQFSEECVDSGIHEECGVFGAYDFDGNDIASTVYYGLFALQHRGQESCGIAVTDTYGERKVHNKRMVQHLRHPYHRLQTHRILHPVLLLLFQIHS